MCTCGTFLSRGIYLSTMRFDSSYSTIANNIVMCCSRLTKTNFELSKSLQEQNTTEGVARRFAVMLISGDDSSSVLRGLTREDG